MLEPRPAAIAATPASTIAEPIPTRMPDTALCSTDASRIAATGRTRDARRAGSIADSTVIETPRPNATASDPPSMTTPPSGSSIPNATNSARSPLDTPTPPTSPSADASPPITADSTSTDPKTWPRPAPMARSIANSRVRCVTVIENVL